MFGSWISAKQCKHSRTQARLETSRVALILKTPCLSCGPPSFRRANLLFGRMASGSDALVDTRIASTAAGPVVGCGLPPLHVLGRLGLSRTSARRALAVLRSGGKALLPATRGLHPESRSPARSVRQRLTDTSYRHQFTLCNPIPVPPLSRNLGGDCALKLTCRASCAGDDICSGRSTYGNGCFGC